MISVKAYHATADNGRAYTTKKTLLSSQNTASTVSYQYAFGTITVNVRAGIRWNNWIRIFDHGTIRIMFEYLMFYKTNSADFTVTASRPRFFQVE